MSGYSITSLGKFFSWYSCLIRSVPAVFPAYGLGLSLIISRLVQAWSTYMTQTNSRCIGKSAGRVNALWTLREKKIKIKALKNVHKTLHTLKYTLDRFLVALWSICMYVCHCIQSCVMAILNPNTPPPPPPKLLNYYHRSLVLSPHVAHRAGCTLQCTD